MTSEAPHRIKIRNGYVNEPMPYAPGGGETLSYVLETPTALAASPEVAKLIADAEARIINIAAGIFPGGFDNNVAAIRRASEAAP